MSPAPSTRNDIAPDILQEAAEWFACLGDPAADATMRERWRCWLAAHPDHARAWQRVEAITGRLAPLAEQGGAARAALEIRRPRHRRKVLKVLTLLLTAGGSGMLAARLPWQEWRHALALRHAAYRTAMGEVRALKLADGGHLWLGSKAALDIAYSRRERRLSLYQGDLLIATAPDIVQPARAFFVETPHGQLRALGTRFAVRADTGMSRVDVFEGAVELTPRHRGEPVRVLAAGEYAVFTRDALTTDGTAHPGREAWARGVLMADGMRLDELIAELRRWHPLAIECAPEVAGLRVVGAFPLNEPARVLAALQASLPVSVRRSEDRASIVARGR